MVVKIKESLPHTSNVPGMPVKDDVRTSGTGKADFKNHLTTVESRNFEHRLNQLVTMLLEQGEKLGKKVDFKELKIYKKLVSEFLDEALNNSHKFSKQSFLDRRGRHRVFAVIKKINGEIDQLTKDILADEKDNLKILQRLDDIRGLVLDIIM